MERLKSTKVRLILLGALTVVSALFLYRTDLLSLISSIFHREGSSHGFFIPFISAYFIWMKWDTLSKIDTHFDRLGFPCLLVGLLIRWLNADGFRVQSISFFIVVSGLIWIFLGTRFFKEISFSLFFLITMIPLPWDFYLHLANMTRNVTYEVSCWVMSLLDIPYFREGYVVSLPNATLEVALSCSGIRYLISYLVFGMAYAYLTRRKMWSRLLVMGAVLPISLFASVCRLTVIFAACYWVSPRAGEYKPHLLISWSVFVAVLVVSLLLDRIICEKLQKAK